MGDRILVVEDDDTRLPTQGVDDPAVGLGVVANVKEGDVGPARSFPAATLYDRDVESLAERGVFVWDGNYYALEIMERLGLQASGGAVRIGFCHYNTPDEVDRVLEELAALA